MGKWFFGRIQITEELLSILLIKFVGGVSWNEFRVCTCKLQLAIWANCLTDFLFTLGETLFWISFHWPNPTPPPPPPNFTWGRAALWSLSQVLPSNTRKNLAQYLDFTTSIFFYIPRLAHLSRVKVTSKFFPRRSKDTGSGKKNKNLPTCTQCSYIITHTWQLGILVLVLYYATELSNLRSPMYFTGKTKLHLSLTI